MTKFKKKIKLGHISTEIGKNSNNLTVTTLKNSNWEAEKKLTNFNCDGTKKLPTYVRVVTDMPVVTVVTFVTNKLFSDNNNF